MQQRSLARAARRLDSAAATGIIRDCFDRAGIVWTWSELLAPVLRTLGQRYEAGDADADGIDVEHHLSHIVVAELLRRTDVPRPINPRPVLLAAAPDEQHTLPLFALAAALAERSIETKVLGGRTPDEALAAAVRRTGPVAVFVWAQARPITDLTCAVPAIRPAAAVVVGGPGWRGFELPEGVQCPRDLAEAVTALTSVVRPDRVGAGVAAG